MIGYAIEAAHESKLFDKIVVSTDDIEIAQVAEIFKASIFMREPDDGMRGTQAVAQEVLIKSVPKADEVCVIYPCSPLLHATDLIGASQVLRSRNANYVMSVQEDPLADAGCFYYGAGWAFRTGLALIGPWTVMLPMPAERCIDINTESDWQCAESMFDALRRAPHED